MYYISKYSMSKKESSLCFVVFIYASVMGMRYGVGIDFYNYKDLYLGWDASEYKYNDIVEPGYGLLMSVCKIVGLSYPAFFFLLSFLQLFFILFTLKNINGSVPYVCLSFILTGIGVISFTNGIRQCLSFSLFVYSLNYICRRSFAKYLFVILVATSIHKSALMLLPFYAFAYVNITFLEKKIMAFIPAICIFIMFSGIENEFLGYFDTIIFFLGYDKYLDRSEMMDVIASLGFTDILYAIINTAIILSIKRIRMTFEKQSNLIRIIYLLWLIGIIGETLFRGSLMLQRVFLYFTSFKFIMYGLFLLYTRKNYSKKIYGISGYNLMFYFVNVTLYWRFFRILCSASSYTADYIFFFQEDLYIYKHMQI